MSLLMLKQNMLLSIIIGMTNHSHHPHLMTILSPMYTGLRKREMRQPTLPLEPALLRNKSLKTNQKLTWASIADLERLVPTQVTTTIG